MGHGTGERRRVTSWPCRPCLPRSGPGDMSCCTGTLEAGLAQVSARCETLLQTLRELRRESIRELTVGRDSTLRDETLSDQRLETIEDLRPNMVSHGP